MPLRISGVFENWISLYATTCTWLPHGSRNELPPKMSIPASRADSEHGVAVVDDEAEVARRVRPLRAALREREELVAHVDERHPRDPSAQLQLEQAPVEVERLVDRADLERDVVDPDGASHSWKCMSDPGRGRPLQGSSRGRHRSRGWRPCAN